ncbi:MAG: sigma-70 family RNA polymerase sigma factor [Planctomycetota bacterium]
MPTAIHASISESNDTVDLEPVEELRIKSDTMDSSHQETPSSILQRIAEGEASAVDDCLTQYGGLVWSLANRYSPTKADAEDAAQEVFVEIWRNAGRFDPTRASEATFISMITRRRLIDRHRRTQSAPAALSISEAPVELPESPNSDPVELADETAKANRCLNKLSLNQREILTLSIQQGEPQSAIASILNMPLGSVKSYARRGLIQLRECMKRPLAAEAAS